MPHNQWEHLLGLVVVTVVALGAVALLLRSGARGVADHGGTVLGYPPELFPDREVVRGSPLSALAATQARLVSIYTHIPAHGDSAVWLNAFLRELREIMNTAYRVAVIAQVYNRPAALERLVAEVRHVEQEIAEQIAQRLLLQDGDAHDELLAGRLATLRLCARELAVLADGSPPIGIGVCERETR